MKIIVFGTGYVYEKYKHRLSDFDIVAFLDNSNEKYNNVIDGVVIDRPENHYKYDYEAIIIMSVHFVEMRKQLIELGVPEEKIVDERHRGIFEKCVIKHEYIVRDKDSGSPKILLVSNELSSTGAPIVLLNMAEIMVTQGLQVDLITTKKGPLLYDFIKLGINVFIYDWYEMVSDNFFNDYNLVVLNTIMVNQIAARLKDRNIPIIWWLHEDKPSLQEFKITADDIPIGANIHPLAVSKRVQSAYIDYTGDTSIMEFCYGIHKFESIRGKRENKTICAIIGYVGNVKGQDILLKAVEKNEERWKDEIEFWIIGSISAQDRKIFSKHPCIKVWGRIDHNRLIDLFSDIDIVLCASRHESMSVSVVEGMMLKKLCIVSDQTGNAEYCIPYENALVIKSEDEKSLAHEIDWALGHKEAWPSIAKNGYKVFEDHFGMTNFRERVSSLINDYLKRS